MKISPERLAADAEATGFQPEVLEKTFHLLGLLDALVGPGVVRRVRDRARQQQGHLEGLGVGGRRDQQQQRGNRENPFHASLPWIGPGCSRSDPARLA